MTKASVPNVVFTNKIERPAARAFLGDETDSPDRHDIKPVYHAPKVPTSIPVDTILAAPQGPSMPGYPTSDGEVVPIGKVIESLKACWTNRISFARSAPRRPSIGNDILQSA